VAAWSARIERAPGAKLELHGRLVLGYQSFLPDFFGERSSEGALISLAPGSRLETGDGVLIANGAQVHVAPGAEVTIGDRTYLNPNSRILSARQIQIGADCAIAWGVQIMDFDGHELERDGEWGPSEAPVRIGDRVWIGARATVLKGVTIGDGAVIGAAAVVTRDVPPRTLCAGNPAKVVRENIAWRNP
jgi:acetyltransferase-like isoleucine patch superfamily enzyme